MRSMLLTLHALLLACAGAPSDGATSTDTGTTSALSTTTGDQPTTTALDTTSDTSTTAAPLEPVCCGCLCLDPEWSCAANTCLLEDGTAAALGPEAGFLAIPRHEIAYRNSSEEVVTEAAEARLWYVFQPADEAPETRPLAVFFNGGPGYSTAVLFGLNTGKKTADPDVAGPAIVADNPHSWTRFANLLYVDPREAGFSYDIAPPEADGPERVPFLPEHDAAFVSQFILRFLGRHPQLEKNPVILVGESYGGLRAALISEQLAYPHELLTATWYRNQQLHDAVHAHLMRTIPDLPAGPLGPTVGTAQFGARVLIQPQILTAPPEASTPQENRAEQYQCVADPDLHQCDEPNGWTTQYNDAAVMALLDPTTLSAMTGVDVTTIAWLYADARASAYPRGKGSHDTSALTAVFGAPPPDDDIYHHHNGQGAPSDYNPNAPRYSFSFLRTLPFVRTLITHAGKDIHIFIPDLPATLASYEALIASAVHVGTPVGDEARPGRIVVEYRSELGLPETEHIIRSPFYPAAGHMVTHRASAELLEDLEAWFNEE